MAVGYNPRMITNGLVLCLDAGNTRSYPGSGTTWTDLSGNGNNGTLVNSPTFSTNNGGYFSFNGTSTYVSFVSSSSFSFGTGDFTVDYWFFWNNFTNLRTVLDMRNVDSGVGYSDYNGTNGSFNIYNGVTSTTVFTSTSNFSASVWYNVTITRISNSVTVYINSVKNGNSYTDTSNYTNNGLILGTNISLTATAYNNGRLSSVKLYKGKGLTAAEISQNFNAIRGRYGI